MSAAQGMPRGYAENQAAIRLGKTGGFCWYCGARLYLREDADDELKRRLVFTVDHLHPRVHGGRGRANKVPACKYCNSHKSSRSVEQFREWARVRLSGRAKSAVPQGWRINAEGVIFYFELVRFGHSRAAARASLEGVELAQDDGGAATARSHNDSRPFDQEMRPAPKRRPGEV